MTLKNATKDTVFVGAIVYMGKVKLHVYKANAKSLYVGEMTEKLFSEKVEASKKAGFKWTEFALKNGAKKVSYDGLTMSTEEAARREGFIQMMKARESMKDWLGKPGKKVIKGLLALDKKNRSVTMTPASYGNHKIYMLAIHPDKNGLCLFRLDEAYFFYDAETEVYTRFKKDIHKDGANVIWPERLVEKVAI